MPVKIDGQILDIAPAVRGFQRYTSEMRSNMMSSHRLGWKQKGAIGEVFWMHELAPDRAFPTKNAAYRYVLQKLSGGPAHV